VFLDAVGFYGKISKEGSLNSFFKKEEQFKKNLISIAKKIGDSVKGLLSVRKDLKGDEEYVKNSHLCKLIGKLKKVLLRKKKPY